MTGEEKDLKEFPCCKDKLKQYLCQSNSICGFWEERRSDQSTVGSHGLKILKGDEIIGSMENYEMVNDGNHSMFVMWPPHHWGNQIAIKFALWGEPALISQGWSWVCCCDSQSKPVYPWSPPLT